MHRPFRRQAAHPLNCDHVILRGSLMALVAPCGAHSCPSERRQRRRPSGAPLEAARGRVAATGNRRPESSWPADRATSSRARLVGPRFASEPAEPRLNESPVRQEKEARSVPDASLQPPEAARGFGSGPTSAVASPSAAPLRRPPGRRLSFALRGRCPWAWVGGASAFAPQRGPSLPRHATRVAGSSLLTSQRGVVRRGCGVQARGREAPPGGNQRRMERDSCWPCAPPFYHVGPVSLFRPPLKG